MNTQPEALRLAQELARELEALNLTKDETLFQEMVLAQELVRELEASAAHRGGAMDRQAAAELRRLHAANAALLEALKAIELALALPSVTPTQVLHESGAIRQGIRAAIAKAEEVQP